MGLLQMIFRPNDGTRAAVKAEVAASAAARESAINRFEKTVQEVLELNDRITGRAHEKRTT